MAVFDNETAASLETLVGEGKKYANADELAKAYQHASTYIEQLKTENSGIREDLNKRATAEEILEQIRKGADRPSGNTEEITPPVVKPPVSDDDLVNRIREVTTAERERERIAINVTTVADALVATYGSEAKANEVVRAKAAELGVSTQWLQDVAARSPKAFFVTIGISEPTQTTNSAPKQDANPQALAANTGGAIKPATYAFYENLRRTDSKLYWTPKVQNQMMKDAIAKGDAFHT